MSGCLLCCQFDSERLLTFKFKSQFYEDQSETVKHESKTTDECSGDFGLLHFDSASTSRAVDGIKSFSQHV